MYKKFKEIITNVQVINIIQAENPDGDSLGSALALEEVLSDLGKDVHLYCPVDIPKYIRYLNGWSRVTNDFFFKADLNIIVDTAAEVLLSKLLDDGAIKNSLYNKPTAIIDHHSSQPDIKFDCEMFIDESAVSTSDLLLKIFLDCGFKINPEAARNLLAAQLSDTLGLTSQNVTSDSYRTAATLIDLGANITEIEESRRELMKKSPRILDYKADLIKKTEYHLDGKLATVHIGWDEIREFSDEYNPNVLILEELRLVEGVEVSVSIKTYPDGKLTGKVRSNKPIAGAIAGFFGGGGHDYASGFRVYETFDQILPELVRLTDELLNQEGSESDKTI